MDEGELPGREQLVEAAKTKEVIQALVNSEGWHMLLDVMKARRASLEQQVLHQVLTDGNSVYRQEFMKGQAYQLLLIEQIPEQMLLDAEQVMAVLTPEEQEDNDE